MQNPSFLRGLTNSLIVAGCTTLLALLVTQATVGIVQSNLGLPIALVGAHMVLSVMIVATTVLAALSLRAPAAQGVEVDDVREAVPA